MLNHAEGTGAIKQQQFRSRNQDGQHLYLKHKIDHIEAWHANKEQKAGNDIEGESRNSPRNELMQGRQGQLFEEAKDSQIQNSDGRKQQYKNDEMQVLQYGPHPHRRIDDKVLDVRDYGRTRRSDRGRRLCTRENLAVTNVAPSVSSDGHQAYCQRRENE